MPVTISGMPGEFFDEASRADDLGGGLSKPKPGPLSSHAPTEQEQAQGNSLPVNKGDAMILAMMGIEPVPALRVIGTKNKQENSEANQ